MTQMPFKRGLRPNDFLKQTSNGPNEVQKTDTKQILNEPLNRPKTYLKYIHLFGLEKDLIKYLFRNQDRRLTLKKISDEVKKSNVSVKKTIQRLEKKKLVIRTYFQRGLGGYSMYRLDESLDQEMKELEV